MFNDYVYLYVEGDSLSREGLKLLFKRVMRVERLYVFENSADFMTKVKALPEKPDVILFDIHVAPITGFEILKLLRQDTVYEKTKVVALIDSVMNKEVELIKASGFDAVISKPINVGRFPVLMTRVLQGSS